jgi:hypothetical protein
MSRILSLILVASRALVKSKAVRIATPSTNHPGCDPNASIHGLTNPGNTTAAALIGLVSAQK